MIEIKMNKEIRDYTETVYFGLSMRQCVFAAIAIVVAVIVFLVSKSFLGLETASWLCILAATPFALLGFFKYNGMNAETFLKVWIKSEILMPRRLIYKSRNLISTAILKSRQETKAAKRRGIFKNVNKNIREHDKER